MYPSKENSGYGQHSYSGQPTYGQITGTGTSQGQSAKISINQEANISGFRSHPTQDAQYTGPYAALYGAAALSAQVGVGGKGSGSSGFQDRMNYPSALATDPSKYSSGELGSNLRMKEREAYLGRDLQSDPSRRFADSSSLSQQHQAEMHERMIQESLLQQQQMLKAQALQSGSDMRQTDYLAARSAQEYSPYGGRADVDPRTSYVLGSTPYGSQHAASIIGRAPARKISDLNAQGSSSSGYGVGLPPGRDYLAGRSLRGPSLESAYQGNALLHGHSNFGASMVDEREDDRMSYRRDIDMRDEQLRRELMRAREKDREREELERQKEKERQRERDREREERERQREKDRERDRLELREKERERDRKRRLESRRERTPPRSSRDRRGSSLLKVEKTPRRASPRRSSPTRRSSPRRDVVLRRHSPVKEKKREYICKVYPFSLVEAERDYLSLSKRYPRLSISPECSKVVLHWPKGSLHLSFYTPISFEHEVVEVDSKDDKEPDLSDGSSKDSKLTNGSIVWNAKVILMSGISSDVLDVMSSYETDEKIQHVNNILKFAILKKNSSFTAIGGPWSPTIDGGDPTVGDFSLIQAARRYVRDITQVDIQNCQRWNRFLEIHYDRVGSDGLFSHKEITVLFVPDLSECIPSLESWRSQWFAHKKDVAERERKLSAKQEKKSTEKKESLKENTKAEEENSRKKTEDSKESVKESKKHVAEQKGKELLDQKANEKAVDEATDKGKVDSEKVAEAAAVDTPVKKTGKKKVVKKVVKKPVAENQDEKTVEKKEHDESASNQGTVVKTTGKKKIIRKVIKRKVTKPEVKDVNAVKESTEEGGNVTVQKSTGEVEGKAEKDVSVVEIKEKVTEEPKKSATDKASTAGMRAKAEKESKKDDESDGHNLKSGKAGAKDSVESEARINKDTVKDDQDGKKRTKDEKDKDIDKKSKDPKHNEAKEKGKLKDPPQHPGFILQTRRSKETKFRSMSLSLDGLLDYNDKDIEEPVFELSVFAESMNEMLQYQMGCCLLSFLEKVRRKFIANKNKRKRERDDKSGKESEKESSAKRSKVTDETAGENESKKAGPKDKTDDNKVETVNEDRSSGGQDDSKTGNGTVDGNDGDEDAADDEDIEEDPEMLEEEDPEMIEEEDDMDEDQDEEDASPSNEANEDDVVKPAADTEKPKIKENDNEKSTDDKSSKSKVTKDKSDEKKEGDKKSENVKSDSGKEVVVMHKEALQAFRYFDQNRVGYIKVEDLRCLLHNLGKFLSHRDIKEMVQSALLESNTGRDNRIFYKKLVRMNDI